MIKNLRGVTHIFFPFFLFAASLVNAQWLPKKNILAFPNRKTLKIVLLVIVINFLKFQGGGVAPTAADENYVPSSIKIGHIMNYFSEIVSEDVKIAVMILYEARLKQRYPSCDIQVVMYPDVDSAVKAAMNREFDCIGMMTLDYFKTKNYNNIIPVRNASIGQNASANFVLLVSSDQLTSLDMLQNKKIIIGNGGLGELSLMWIDTLLMSQAFPESNLFFSSIKRMDKVSQSILKVFFGNADACIVPRKSFEIMNERNPQVGKKLVVLSESTEFHIGVFGVVKGIDEKKKEFIENEIDSLTSDEEGKHILYMFRVGKIKPFNPEYLDSIETLYSTYTNLKTEKK